MTPPHFMVVSIIHETLILNPASIIDFRNQEKTLSIILLRMVADKASEPELTRNS